MHLLAILSLKNNVNNNNMAQTLISRLVQKLNLSWRHHQLKSGYATDYKHIFMGAYTANDDAL